MRLLKFFGIIFSVVYKNRGIISVHFCRTVNNFYVYLDINHKKY